MERLILERSYQLEDQQYFAELSGDYNPLHLNERSARREIFGAIVVHGIHMLLDGCERMLATRKDHAQSIKSVDVKFMQPVPLNKMVRFLLKETDAHLSISVQDDERKYATFSFEMGMKPPHAPFPVQYDGDIDPVGVPAQHSFASLEGLQGSVELKVKFSSAESLFPRTFREEPLLLTHALAMTRLVGMKCPGLRSIFSALHFTFTDRDKFASSLDYATEKCDKRFSIININVRSANGEGVLRTFLRPEPVGQLRMSEAGRKINPGIFKNQVALIIGGSRGIGEVAAKIIAAGSGTPVISYLSGVDEATQVYQDIKNDAKQCEMIQCDVLGNENIFETLKQRSIRPTHLYYFASPKIFVSRKKYFDAELYDKFSLYYVTAFGRMLGDFKRVWPEASLKVYYPSSEGVTSPIKSLTEYAVAKQAGEAACDVLNRFLPGIKISKSRLPRLPTDQTATLVAAPTAPMFETILEVVHLCSE